MTTILRTISKEELIQNFKEIFAQGWIENKRGNNDGAVGNTLEDLLHIPENNLPIPNAAEWELKAQRSNTTSLLTLFHMEPSPRALKVVNNILLPKYGWPSKQAGSRYKEDERSFRATLNTSAFSSRGFKVVVNDSERKVEIMFDSSKVIKDNTEWLQNINTLVGNTNDFEIRPYWGFDDLFHKAGTKLINCFYVRADVKRERINSKSKVFFLYDYVLKLSHFDQDRFISAIRNGKVFFDFDARTHHNHGTKIRIHYNDIPLLYRDAEVVIDNRPKNQQI